MLVDLRELAASERAAALAGADICIVGAGIAGLLLADHLSRHSQLHILLLEAGGHGQDPVADALLPPPVLAGEPHPGSVVGRVCAVGGCSLTWGGQLLPLPENVRWAIPASELATYIPAVQTLFRVDHLPYEAAGFFADRHMEAPLLLSAIEGTQALISKFIPFPLRNLARKIVQRLRRQPNVRLVLHAAAEKAVLTRAGDAVEAMRVICPGAGAVLVRAKRYVVSAGAVETVRLLLSTWADRDVAPPNVLGHGFCDHLTAEVASFEGLARGRIVQDLRPWVVGRLMGTVHAAKWEAAADLCRALGMQGAIAHPVFEEPAETSAAALRSWLRGRQKDKHQTLSSARYALAGAAQQMVALGLTGRRWVSPQARVALRVNVVQQVPTASRIRLGTAPATGHLPEAVLEWKVADAEVEGIRAFGRHLRAELAKAGFTANTGVRWTPALDAAGAPFEDLDDARHAMGGAALGTSPAESVVDPTLAIHGVRGLYVASTAVFPDGAPHLPTLTLMALTLRLGEHLLREA